MQLRVPGASDLEVSALGLGCMRMSFGGTPTGKQANSGRARSLHRATARRANLPK